jgi:hypothetical protein
MALTGDFKKLGHWADLMRNGSVIAEASSEALAQKSVDLIEDGFNAGRDPYGRMWVPKQRPNGYATLHGKTGLLEYTWHVVKTKRRGFIVASDAPYAAAHQKPKRGKRPMRMMVPSTARGLPASWSRAFEKLYLNLVNVYLSGGAVNDAGGLADDMKETG